MKATLPEDIAAASAAGFKPIGFGGLCSVELFRPAYWERDPAELASAARAATLDVVGHHFEIA